MIRADLLIKSPLFLIGLCQTLAEAGIKVIAIRTSPYEDPFWLADAALIDAAAIPDPGDLISVTAAAKSTAVLVFTNESATNDEIYLQAGASGVISKGESGESIIRAVRGVAAGHAVRATEASPPAPEPLENAGRQLSKREEQVLRQIAHGLTHSQVAARLGISPHTVDTYVKRIRVKLGVGNKAELTRAALLGQLIPQADRIEESPAVHEEAASTAVLGSAVFADAWPSPHIE